MNKKIDTLLTFLAILAILAVVLGIGRCKYSVWRGKYPNAANWHFFVPESR